ncbi:transposase [Chelativorans alearense]|uniref:transposase n=1 Tax=Chelativorans alearense TaxID=2681495 RepID=UPI003CCD49DD
MRRIGCSSIVAASRSTAVRAAEKGALVHGIGRTKGGRNTKLHAVCDARGRPHVLLLIPGNVHDCKVAKPRGVPAWEVQGLLGHKAVGVTEVYAKFDPDYMATGSRAIDNYFAELGPASDIATPIRTSLIRFACHLRCTR